jgi:hypothetical protein
MLSSWFASGWVRESPTRAASCHDGELIFFVPPLREREWSDLRAIKAPVSGIAFGDT